MTSPGRRAIIDVARARFRAIHDGAPAHAWWVPGRLEILGKHTDYCGGRTLVAALPRGLVVLASPRADDQILIADALRAEVMRLPDAPDAPGARHVKTVITRLQRNFPGAPRGVTIVFASGLPRSAGMSSSSALMTGLVVALARLWQLDRRDEWLAHIATAEDLAVYCASVESGRTLGTLEGDRGVGTRGGSEDHAAILLASPGHVSAFGFLPLRRLRDTRLPDDWQIVIGTSGVTASKSGAMRDHYNRLSRAAAVLLDLWNVVETPSESLAAALASAPTAADRLRELINRTAVQDWTADALERRLAHFEVEDALVAEAIRAVESADADALGEISEASQLRASLLLGNQVPETMALARLARECGAFAASSFGAGFGGAVWALVPRADTAAFSEQWMQRYRREFPSLAAEAFIAPPSAPLGELLLDQ